MFKVEVVGDCYVAVCGLPDPRPDHAVVMAKFSSECVREMGRLTKELEIELGPDTADLGLRVGLHSGPVLAGVLRGEKSRFQLFGDTMNTAARMESTGITNMVQVSQETADLLAEARKGHWCEPREEQVQAKGKGNLTTYFLRLPAFGQARSMTSASDTESTRSGLSSFNSGVAIDNSEVVDKRNRIADWTVEVLSGLLKEIHVRRMATKTRSEPQLKLLQMENSSSFGQESGTVIDEVQEIVELPKFDVAAAEREAQLDANAIQLDEVVLAELRDFVQMMAAMYHDNGKFIRGYRILS